MHTPFQATQLHSSIGQKWIFTIKTSCLGIDVEHQQWTIGKTRIVLTQHYCEHFIFWMLPIDVKCDMLWTHATNFWHIYSVFLISMCNKNLLLFTKKMGTNKLVKLDRGIYKPYCITQPLIPNSLANRSSLKEEAQIHHWSRHQINGLEKTKLW